jgi:hypothetical protein
MKNGDWEEDASPSNAPFYFDYSKPIDKSYLDTTNSTLTFYDMPSVETIFMFSVVEVCKDCSGTLTATVLATRMWSSVDGPWGFNGLTAAGNEYYDDFINNIFDIDRKQYYHFDMYKDKDGELHFIKTDIHNVIIIIPATTK